MKVIVLCVSLLWAAPLFAQEWPEGSNILKLTFSGTIGDGASLAYAGTEPGTSRAPSQCGMPQLAPLYFELMGGEDEVLYAGRLSDPRMRACSAAAAPASLVAEVRVPAFAEARKLVVYRRADPAADPVTVLEVGL